MLTKTWFILLRGKLELCDEDNLWFVELAIVVIDDPFDFSDSHSILVFIGALTVMPGGSLDSCL